MRGFVRAQREAICRSVRNAVGHLHRDALPVDILPGDGCTHFHGSGTGTQQEAAIVGAPHPLDAVQRHANGGRIGARRQVEAFFVAGTGGDQIGADAVPWLAEIDAPRPRGGLRAVRTDEGELRRIGLGGGRMQVAFRIETLHHNPRRTVRHREPMHQFTAARDEQMRLPVLREERHLRIELPKVGLEGRMAGRNRCTASKCRQQKRNRREASERGHCEPL